MKVLISAQACLLLLNRETNFFPKLVTVVIYPSAYVSKNSGGPVFGESWNSGELVLTWATPARLRDGITITILHAVFCSHKWLIEKCHRRGG